MITQKMILLEKDEQEAAIIERKREAEDKIREAKRKLEDAKLEAERVVNEANEEIERIVKRHPLIISICFKLYYFSYNNSFIISKSFL